ncbi:RNA-directed DNA polymerase [Thiolapillus sp.]|uniref:RNA-directed DNA polymerase n=1 Tax=Thiolapillus sp. TaxID=2017437 RepID=UPI003AF54986
MLKVGQEHFVKFLTTLFNHVFSSGIFPDIWTKSVIVPIYKKGDVHCVDNYRGVSLLSIVSKCYTSILNNRLYNWAEDCEKITESQAGFRKGYSTTDHIFTLYAMTQKYLSKKGGKLYVVFVDLRRAFDSVRYSKLLDVLQKNGLSEHFTKAIMSMYKSVKAFVKIYQETTDEFDCEKGLRQGCILSPTLFSIFINEIANKIEEFGRHGVQLIPGLVELFILLFADDLALMASTPQGLQYQLDILTETCKQLGVEINTSKTKAMVFRNGGFLAKN